MEELTRAAWRVSSRSGGQGQCVEVALTSNVVGVRDTKNRNGGTLAVAPEIWTGFVTKIKHGELDH
ncbi:DUF397 domain-containing protein [Saccharopolyspora spinosa]|uniref:Uncharacterized protein DUF397 n=1 Tax=Saccharopolyspora spinosa TaxID=60894 RepID=A0A2N3XUC3_SACSN|nr:DUF397 domain-containing protein [Saccharopolyspora spinosa]PKW14286.1 uncharacterized protein DUF397 [Saccharopolyspora spinosa]